MTPTVRLNMLDRLILWVSGYFGHRSKEVERFLKFSVVGTVGAIVDFGTLNLLQSTLLVPLPPYQSLKVSLASGTAFGAAVISNFVWNRYWTYPDSRSRSIRRQLTIFFFINTIGLVFRIIFVNLSYHGLGKIAVSAAQRLSLLAAGSSAMHTNRIGTNAAQLIAVIAVLFWNFFANRYWTYNDVDA